MDESSTPRIKCVYFDIEPCCRIMCRIYGRPKHWLQGHCPSYKPICEDEDGNGLTV